MKVEKLCFHGIIGGWVVCTRCERVESGHESWAYLHILSWSPLTGADTGHSCSGRHHSLLYTHQTKTSSQDTFSSPPPTLLNSFHQTLHHQRCTHDLLMTTQMCSKIKQNGVVGRVCVVGCWNLFSLVSDGVLVMGTGCDHSTVSGSDQTHLAHAWLQSRQTLTSLTTAPMFARLSSPSSASSAWSSWWCECED